jgi:hypothetical protein
MTYTELKTRQEKEHNNFPFMFAFSNKQFSEGMKKLGLLPTDTDKILSIGGGGYIRKTDRIALSNMTKRHHKETEKAMQDDQYLYAMFLYELGNHEYCITYDVTDTLSSLGLTVEDVNASERMTKALIRATKDYLKFYE